MEAELQGKCDRMYKNSFLPFRFFGLYKVELPHHPVDLMQICLCLRRIRKKLEIAVNVPLVDHESREPKLIKRCWTKQPFL
jgi:hypothetical protein